MQDFNARHGACNINLERIERIIRTGVIAIAVCGIQTDNAIAVRQSQASTANQRHLERVTVPVKRQNAHKAIAVDVIDVEINICHGDVKVQGIIG